MRWQKKICLPKIPFIYLTHNPNIIQTSPYHLSTGLTPHSSTSHLPFFFSSSPHSNIPLSSVSRFPFLLFFFSSIRFASPPFLSSSTSFLQDRSLILLKSLTRKPHEHAPFERETIGRPKHDRSRERGRGISQFKPKHILFVFIIKFLSLSLCLFVSLSLCHCLFLFHQCGC